MLGGGLGCWDLDHCLVDGRLAPWAAEVLAGIDDPIWVERSMGGDGLHVFVRAAEAPGFRRGRVEFYSRARFIAVTGDRFRL
jgi:primase-polymerase (primpol)-like protein